MATVEIVSRRVEGDIHRTTYRELHARATHWPTRSKRGASATGDRVATLAWNGYRHMELYYARRRLGRDPAHDQSAARPRPDRVDRQPRRGHVPVLRPDVPADGRDGRGAFKTIKHFVAMTDRAHMPASDHSPEPALLRGAARRASRRTTTGRCSTRTSRRRSATRRAPPAIRRACSTAIARRCCTPSRAALPDALSFSART